MNIPLYRAKKVSTSWGFERAIFGIVSTMRTLWATWNINKKQLSKCREKALLELHYINQEYVITPDIDSCE